VTSHASLARFLTVARLVKARGNRGELAGEIRSDDPGIIRRSTEVYLWDGGGQRRAVRIREIWTHRDRWIFQFEGIDTIDQARRLQGWEVQIPAEQRPPAPEGRYYLADLVGCKILESGSGRSLGDVRDVLDVAGRPLLQIEQGGREILVPFASALCVEIDIGQRIIRVNLPAGLEELNQS